MNPQLDDPSNPALKPYSYKPLEGSSDIRTLSLTHSSDDRLVCVFQVVHDLVNADYQALSYEWGSKDNVHRIYVEDLQGRQLGYVDVNTNLYHALNDLRNTIALKGQRFWIDQLSIDQSNLLEKGHQVALMKDVYTHASQVITYLGPHHDDMAEELAALDLLHQLHQHFLPNYAEISAASETGDFDDPDAWPVQELPPNVTMHDPAWALLMSIVDGGWRHRLWMVQENVLCPQNVMLRGTRLLDWFSVASISILRDSRLLPLDLSELRTDSSNLDGLLFSDVSDLWAYRKDHVAGKSNPNFQSLAINLEQYTGRKCDDPRDRIYAVLGISSDSAALGISPDYALPVHELYIDTSVRILKHGLALLRYISVVDNLSNTLIPSWAYHDTANQETSLYRNPSSAHPHVSNNVRFSADRTVMTLRGRLFDCVAISAPLNRQPGAYVHYPINETWAEHYNIRLIAIATILEHAGVSLESAGALHRVIAESYDEVPDESAVDDAYNLWLYCLVPAGLLAEFLASTAAHDELPKTITDLFRSLGCLLGQHGKATFDVISEIEIEDIREEYHRAARSTSTDGLSLCVSKDGRICKLTGKARVGDVIAVLAGYEYACVLRPCGQDRYQYVGHGIVHGIMAGELYDGVDPDEVDHDIHLV